MVRYKIIIEYDGTDFVGWQRQDNGFSVQQAIEKAITEFSGETVILFGAGRTDSGVHALGQVAHFDLERDTNANTVANALNFYLRSMRISILSAEAVNNGFDARISAKERAYIYKITNRRGPLSVGRGNSWWVPVPLDDVAMNEAAKVLIGNHDFTTFRATRCQANSPIKTLDELTVTRCGEVVEVRARARSFLHHQMRNIVGTLKLVGEGRWTEADVRTALEAKKRAAGGPTAPPDGLYLVEVIY
ncbi:MAG: tRNA pseudouridine(38-40) synthase TruA [Rhodospirillales bacterium]|nr:tRNA pseudouridine(38-40) synthase TruA [Rhodospirillales bacterium]